MNDDSGGSVTNGSTLISASCVVLWRFSKGPLKFWASIAASSATVDIFSLMIAPSDDCGGGGPDKLGCCVVAITRCHIRDRTSTTKILNMQIK